MSKSRLGKGLGALINESSEESGTPNRVLEIYVENIEPNPYQPRKEFDEKALQELGQSIKENGIIQPITVRQIKPDRFQLVSGERRWRACRLVGKNKILGIVKDYSDRELMEIALVENIQREDLNPIEEAQAYQKMMKEFELTQAQVADKVGKSRSTVANVVRLLNLAPKVQIYVSRGTLSMGHARTLLPLKDHEQQIKAAEHVIKNELSVRKTEDYINSLRQEKNKGDSNNRKEQKTNNELGERWEKARNILANALGTGVKIKKTKKKKIISIECEDYSQFEDLISRIES